MSYMKKLEKQQTESLSANAIAQKFKGQTNLRDNAEWMKLPYELRKSGIQANENHATKNL